MLATLFYSGLIGLVFSMLLVLPFILRLGKSIRRISLSIAALSCFLLLIFSSIAVYKNAEISFLVYEVLPSFQFYFFIDRLSAFFILIISIVSLSISIYSIEYIEHYSDNTKKNILVPLMIFFIISMILVVTSKNMLSFLFFWELMALSSVFLVVFEYEKKETRKASLFYFTMTQLSTAFLLFAFIMLYNTGGSFDIGSMAISSNVTAIFIFLFLGFGIKAGIIPFHKWLPYAHPASPSNISALMSGVMIKVAIYGMIRFALFVLTPELWWGILIFIAGTISMILGVIYALKEHDIKRLLAYHSIENIGIILIGFGLYIIFDSYHLDYLALLSLAGSLFHTLNHALFKSLLFMAAGSVVNSTKTRNIEEMGGLIKTMPYTAIFFFIGAVSISALPPLNGFVSEFMIFKAFFMSPSIGNPLMEVLMILGLSILAITSALAAACFVKAFGIMFLAAPRSEDAEKSEEAPFPMLLGSCILAAFCIIFGVFSYQIFSLLGYPAFTPNLLDISILLIISYAIALFTMHSFASNKVRISETWGCGILSQNSRMEYTASGFSDPIVTIFKSIYRTKKINDRTYFDRYQSIFKEGHAKIHLLKFIEDYLYMPVAKGIDFISLKISKLQQKGLDAHIAYAFITIVVLLLLVGWFA